MIDEIRDECGIFAVACHRAQPNMLLRAVRFSIGVRSRRESLTGAAAYSKPIGHGSGFGCLQRGRFKAMEGDVAIGHVRYSTSGESRIENAQPITVKMWRGQCSLAHNGNLVNAQELRADLEREGSIFHATSDSEVVAHLIAKSQEPRIDLAFKEALQRVEGAYALALVSPEGVLAAKDARGFRPLCVGEIDGAYVFSSETCGLDAVGAKFLRELGAGEIAFAKIQRDGDGNRLSCAIEYSSALEPKQQSLCVFEFIYFARPDRISSGKTYAARAWAKTCQKGLDADLVTGARFPLSAASGFAEKPGSPTRWDWLRTVTWDAPSYAGASLGATKPLNLKEPCRRQTGRLVDDPSWGTTCRYHRLLRSAGQRSACQTVASVPVPLLLRNRHCLKDELAASSLESSTGRKLTRTAWYSRDVGPRTFSEDLRILLSASTASTRGVSVLPEV